MKLEPKLISSIIVRPCYQDGEVWRKERPRFIGELYVNGECRLTSSDYDNEADAYKSVVNVIVSNPKYLNQK